jgi:hypothetical protein
MMEIGKTYLKYGHPNNTPVTCKYVSPEVSGRGGFSRIAVVEFPGGSQMALKQNEFSDYKEVPVKYEEMRYVYLTNTGNIVFRTSRAMNKEDIYLTTIFVNYDIHSGVKIKLIEGIG